MKQAFIITFISLLILIITPGFYCGNSPRNTCSSFSNDTISMHFEITNPSAVFHVNDTIRFYSRISDTMIVNGGTSFISARDRLNVWLNPYKVISNGSSSGLNFATNEFNAIVETGSFQNSGVTGFEIMYNRLQPYNTMRGALIPGQPGLYLITVSLYDYNPSADLFLYDKSNPCINYKAFPNIPIAQQQRQYWDSIGTTTLSMSNNTYNAATKNDHNYFFVKVIP